MKKCVNSILVLSTCVGKPIGTSVFSSTNALNIVVSKFKRIDPNQPTSLNQDPNRFPRTAKLAVIIALKERKKTRCEL